MRQSNSVAAIIGNYGNDVAALTGRAPARIACTRVHLINRSTGKVLGGDDE
jgi:hypothetical protein